MAAERYEKGLEEVRHAISIADEIGLQFEKPRLHLLRGALLLHASRRNFEMVEGCFRLAFEAANAQGARGWALRAMTSMTSLLAERSGRLQARDRLAAIYADFAEGLDTPDLQDAKAFLDQLS
ncbi:MAG: hypothetical protein WCF75_25480 [Pseudolabrys sp.]